MAIIEARGLARTFKSRKRTVEAVRGVDLTVGGPTWAPRSSSPRTTWRKRTSLCDRVFIIDHGVIAAEGTPDELKRRISGDVVTLRVAGGEHGTGTARKLLADQAIVREVSAADGAIKLTVEHGEQALPALLRVLDAAGVTLESINLSRPTLDDVFLTLTGRSLRDDSHPSAASQGRAAAPEPESASAGKE